MSNIMIYVEENLIYSPERCYGEETDVPNTDNRMNSKGETANVPLISPQSTLGNEPLKPPPGFAIPTDPLKLQSILEENSQDRNFQNMPKTTDVPIFTANTSTNPFLQDVAIYSHYGANITPQKFIQLWNENLQLQMQITTAFNALLNKVITNSVSNVSEDISRGGKTPTYEQQFNPVHNSTLESVNTHCTNDAADLNNQTTMKLPTMLNSTFLYADKDAAAPTNFTATNSLETGPFTVSSTHLNNVANVGYSNVNPIFSDCQNIPSHTNSCQENVNSTSHLNLFKNSDNRNTVGNSSLNPLTNVFDDYNTTSKFFINQQRSMNENIHQVSSDFITSTEECRNDTIQFKETNPFKLSLAGKLQITELPDENSRNCDGFEKLVTSAYRNSELIPECDTPKAEHLHRNTSKICENTENSIHREYLFTENLHNASSATKNKTAPMSEHLFSDYKWSIDSISNNISKLAIDVPPVKYCINEEKETVKYTGKEINREKEEDFFSEFYFSSPQRSSTVIDDDIKSTQQTWNKQREIQEYGQLLRRTNSFVPLEENYDRGITHENHRPMSDGDSNNFISSSWLPINSFLSPPLADNLNVDEGYLTRPPTSHTLQSSPPLVQPSSEIDCNQQSLTKNSNESYSVSAEKWMKSVENAISFQPQGMNQSNSSESHNSINNVKATTFHGEDNKWRDIWKSPITKDSTNSGFQIHKYSSRKLFFRAIELPKRIIHVFHHQGEGWLLTDEFVEAFTEFKTSSYMINLLHVLNIHVPFAEIESTEYPSDFAKLESAQLRITRDTDNNISKIHLMPLKSTLKVLNKLGIITRQDIDKAIVNKEFVNGSITHEIWMIINAYGDFKQLIQTTE